jgi:hypothetical protein
VTPTDPEATRERFRRIVERATTRPLDVPKPDAVKRLGWRLR